MKYNILQKEKQGRKTVYVWSNYKDLIFDSKGEAYIYLFIKELQEAGYIDSFELQPSPFVMSDPIKRTYKKQLKTKTKLVEEHVESSQIYTPDFKIHFNQKAIDDNIVIEFDSDIKKLPHHLFVFNKICYIEAKSDSTSLKVFDDNNMIRLAKSKLKSVYEKHKIYVNLVFHNALFRDTFMPQRYLIHDKILKPRKIGYKHQNLKQYIDRVKPKLDGGLLF